MIKPYFILFIFFVCFLPACSNQEAKEPDIPNGILNKETFSRVLADFAMAESAANINIKSATYNKIDSVYAFDPLLENNIRKSQYDSTIEFYTKHPELFKNVYEDVLERLSEILAERTGVKKDSVSK